MPIGDDVIFFCPDGGPVGSEKHYAAKVRCGDCFREWTGLFPCDAEEDELQCPECDKQNSEIIEYLDGGRMIVETKEWGLVEVDIDDPPE